MNTELLPGRWRLESVKWIDSKVSVYKDADNWSEYHISPDGKLATRYKYEGRVSQWRTEKWEVEDEAVHIHNLRRRFYTLINITDNEMVLSINSGTLYERYKRIA